MAREMTPEEVVERLCEENGIRQSSEEVSVSCDFTERRRGRESKLDFENIVNEAEGGSDDLHEYVH